MFDHMGFAVPDFARSKAFYEAALAPLGIKVVREGEGWAAFGDGGDHTALWIGSMGKPPGGFHFAIEAKDRAAVRAFHAAAMAAGGRDNGPPGIRHNNNRYYAAFVFDPDGHNVEAVCRRPEE